MANWAAYKEQEIGLPVFKRAKHGLHFKRPDGQIQAEFVGKPCHYEDGGIWKPIDTKLLVTSGGFYGSPHSDVKIHPDGRVVVNRSDYQQFTELPSAKAGRLAGDRIIREFPGGEQHLIMKEDGFKEEIHVFKPTFPLEKFIAKTTGNLPSKYKAHQITAEGADGNSYTFTGDVAAFGKWLDAAKYPVVIDPDFAGGTADLRLNGESSVFTTARSNSYSLTTGGTTYSTYCGKVGGTYYIYRPVILFNTSSIPDTDVITQVNIKLYATDKVITDSEFDVDIVKNDWSQLAGDTGNATYREIAYDNCLNSDLDDSIWKNSADVTKNNQYTSGDLSTTWVSKTGTTYYGLINHIDRGNTLSPTGGNYIMLASADNPTESCRPVLTVTYTAGGIAIPVVQYYYNRLRRN